MKTAISLPDELGHAADLYAAQLDISRSQLYAKALSEYLMRHRSDDVTEKINTVMNEIQKGKSMVLPETGLGSLRSLEW
jgi:predicted transcriptional regulator